MALTPNQQANVDKALAASNMSRTNQLPVENAPDAPTKPADLTPQKSVQEIGADLHKAGVTMEK